MLPRFSRAEAVSSWGDETPFERWLDIVLALVDVFKEEGTVPAGTTAAPPLRLVPGRATLPG
jgi:hypothetical protein